MDLPSINASDLAAGLGVLTRTTFKIGGISINPFVVLASLLLVCVLLWLAGFAMRRLDRRLARTHMRASNRILIMKAVQILFYFLVFTIGMQMLGISLTALSVFSGAVGVGLGLGLQKIASNFVSGIIMLFEKSIEVGDLIELIDGTAGHVRETNARYTHLETFDGRAVFIPNEEFINQRVISWTHTDKLARATIDVAVAYDADLPLALKLMREAADMHPHRDPQKPSLAILNRFGDSAIELQLLFWVNDVTEGRLEPKSDIMLAILKAFKAHGISIPYPQRELRILGDGPAPTDKKREAA